ncbi:MAG: LysR family transcriptional regulator [Pseudomonadales bacterium]|nr:LysR family transcriptional regulator [Pseudomonadales bacterium]
MDWDDYRYFTAVVEHGSVRGAAKRLGVNPSTVTRRLDRLEGELAVSLFIRSPNGLIITTEGVEVAQRTEQIAHQFRIMESTVKGRDQRISGRIRMAVPDVLASRILLSEFPVFTELYPDIDLELIPGYQNIDLQSAQADIVIRATNEPPESMIGRSYGPLALAAYATPAFQEKHKNLAAAAWVDWAGDTEVARSYDRLRQEFFANVKVAIRCDQIEMQRAAIVAGIGMGVLPCFVGDIDPDLVRLTAMPVQPGPELWILTHPASRSVRRIQVFLAFLRDTLLGQADAIASGLD